MQNSIFKEHFQNSNLCFFNDWKVRIYKSFSVFMNTHLIFYKAYKNSTHVLIYDVLVLLTLVSFYSIIWNMKNCWYYTEQRKRIFNKRIIFLYAEDKILEALFIVSPFLNKHCFGGNKNWVTLFKGNESKINLFKNQSPKVQWGKHNSIIIRSRRK